MKPPPVPLLSTTSPYSSVEDFAVVDVAGHPLVVCACNHSAAVWSLPDGRWTDHKLVDEVEVTSMAATVVGERIVVGGGGEHQGFAQWYLESGAVRSAERDDLGGVASATTVELDGRTWFAGGGTGSVILLSDPVEDVAPEEEDPESIELILSDHGSYAGVGALAAGSLGHRSSLVSGSWDGEVWVWDVREEAPVTTFEQLDMAVEGVALVTVNDHPRVVAAGGTTLLLGDPATGRWLQQLPASAGEGGDITCLDVASVKGRQVAVTGADDGTVHIWDLTNGGPAGAPFTAHTGEIQAIHITELDARTVIITAGHHDELRVWPLDIA
ncbi:WD40 repeat domain-containing protein [Streptomyces sp. LZ34]